ncbi:uracil-DNA glycosylase [Thiomicrospira sp. ALE5]|uniref:uracil-DNA glycosylase n=1 Tax=Thiomicrospira sp. ALE5 TaxID=748650 RepID=UPI0008F02C56|nr:uracil-DNA glycosylase [Thiomicrospira sp. ALE5]SFR52375.1 Uracil-DNA glycosylase [Thiomicrospira sp. ALE5]
MINFNLTDLITDQAWQSRLAPLEAHHQLRELTQFLSAEIAQGQSILPSQQHWFRAFNLTPYHQVKLVIVGQDPYPTPGHANGLSFSVDASVSPLPKSLKNIFQELKDDLGQCPLNGDLSAWATQGVLLLNRVLTLRAEQSNSHQGRGWEWFTEQVIRQLNQHPNNLVFILWGKQAQQLQTLIDPRHHCLISVHPSPLSAYRGFWGSKPFSQTNAYLMQQGYDTIDWSKSI